MKFGCLGPREVLWRFRDTIAQWKKSSEGRKSAKETKRECMFTLISYSDLEDLSIEPENLEGQLLFREMYYAAEYAQGLVFGQIRGNSVCR